MFFNKNLRVVHLQWVLQVVFNDPTLYLNELVELDKSTTVHTKSIISLLTEVFKTTRGENSYSMNKIFSQKRVNYQQRIIKPS